jgi:hypothetical protein
MNFRSSDPAAPWSQRYFTYFWDQRIPQEVQFDLETRTGVLMPLQPGIGPLSYLGGRRSYDLTGPIELRLEGCGVNGNLYSLTFHAAQERKISERTKFLTRSEMAFQKWMCDLNTTSSADGLKLGSGERYEQLVQAAREWDAHQATIIEDPAEIAAAQKAVLDEFRAGKGFFRTNKEGAHWIRIEDGVFASRSIGEDESVTYYQTEPEITAYLRQHFNWDARRDTLPHKPPEAEIWKYIGKQLK